MLPDGAALEVYSNVIMVERGVGGCWQMFLMQNTTGDAKNHIKGKFVNFPEVVIILNAQASVHSVQSVSLVTLIKDLITHMIVRTL